MTKKRKIFAILTLTAAFLCVGASAVACADDSSKSDPKPVKPTVPTVADVTADVIDSPYGIDMNGCELLDVYLDGEKVPETHFVTRNGKFIFAYETYGDELAVGEYDVKLSFAEGDVTYTLTVEDEKDPVISYSVSSSKTAYVKGDVLELPLVERLNDYQEYDCVYEIYDSEGNLTHTYTNVTEESDPIVWTGVDQYTLKVTLKRGDKTVKTLQEWKFAVQPFVGSDIFSEANVGENGWMVGSSSTGAINYNGEEKTLEFTNKASSGMRSDQTVNSYPIETFKSAKAEGYEALSFTVTPNELMTATPWFDLPTADNKVAWNSMSAAGMRIFGATKRADLTNKIRHDYVVWENDVNYINRGNQGSGVYVYKDVYVTEMSLEGTQVVIDIDEFLSLGADIQYFSFVLGGAQGSVLSIGDTEWFTQEELTAYETAKLAADKEAYKTKNYAAEDMLYRWGVHKNSAYITRSYDKTANALKATVNTNGGHSKSQTNIFAMGALDLRYAYEKLGFTHVTVQWRASEEMLNPPTDSTGEGRRVRLFSNVVNTAPDGAQMDVPNLGTTSSTFEISLAEWIGTKNAKYLCFVISGDVGDAVWFESITLTTKA